MNNTLQIQHSCKKNVKNYQDVTSGAFCVIVILTSKKYQLVHRATLFQVG